MRTPDGTSLGTFYDGLFWPSLLYTWRAFDAKDTVLKVSGFGWPMAHIRLALPVPPHWLVLPPSQQTLWRLYSAGYDDCSRYFASESRTSSAALPSQRRDSAAPPLPPPSALPPAADRGGQVTLLFIVALGWLHLLLLTVLCPLVPFYLAFRDTLRSPSTSESSRQASAAASPASAHAQYAAPQPPEDIDDSHHHHMRSPIPASPALTTEQIDTSAPAVLFMWGRWAVRGLVVIVVLGLWPLALLLLVSRVLWPWHEVAPLHADLSSPPPSHPASPRPNRPEGPRAFTATEGYGSSTTERESSPEANVEANENGGGATDRKRGGGLLWRRRSRLAS